MEALVAAYHADRAALDAAHPSTGNPLVCRYCGGVRQPWAGSRFEGHVACVVSPAFKQRIVGLFAEVPTLGYGEAALALGVTSSIVRAWWNAGKRNPRP